MRAVWSGCQPHVQPRSLVHCGQNVPPGVRFAATWSSTASAARDVLVVPDAPAVAKERVRVRDAAHPRDVHVSRSPLAYASGRTHAVSISRGGSGSVVPAVEPVRGERRRAHRRDTQAGSERAEALARAARSALRQSPSTRSNSSVTRLAGPPAVRLDVGRRRRLGAVVAERLLAVGKSSQIVGRAVAIGEADAGLAEQGSPHVVTRPPPRANTAGVAQRSARNDHASDSMRADVDPARREAREDPRAARRAVLAVEDARDEPPRVVGRRQARARREFRRRPGARPRR